jgi:hypothetical protein
LQQRAASFSAALPRCRRHALVRRLRRARSPLSDRPTTLLPVLPFDHLFPELATREVLLIEDASTRPSTIFVFREFYCTDPRCDCRRVVLHATVDGRPRVIASIGMASSARFRRSRTSRRRFSIRSTRRAGCRTPCSTCSRPPSNERQRSAIDSSATIATMCAGRTWSMTRGIPIIERSGAPTTTIRRSVQHTRLATKAFRPTSAASAEAARSTRTVADEQRQRLRGPLGRKGDLQRVHVAHHACSRTIHRAARRGIGRAVVEVSRGITKQLGRPSGVRLPWRSPSRAFLMRRSRSCDQDPRPVGCSGA